MSSSATVYKSDVYAGSTVLISALVRNLMGDTFSPADISSISYTIYDYQQFTNATPTAVTGHDNVSLTVSDVMFTAESRMYNGSSKTVNFQWIIDNSTNQPFPDNDHIYEVRINFTPVDGVCSPIVLRLTSK